MNHLIGAHVSSAGGVALAMGRAAAIGANAAQIFSGSPRSWGRTPLASLDVSRIAAARKEQGIKAVVTHALYLINLVSEKPSLVEQSVKALQYDLAFDSAINGSGVVVHTGSHKGKGFESVRDELVKTLKHILETTPKNSHLLLENAAGHNGKVGGDLAEIAWLVKTVNSPRLGWCFDTCHGFAAGYNLSTVPSVIKELGLWDSLKMVHVNDSRDPFESGRDRHANLGDGSLDQVELAKFLRLPQLSEIPFILEVPGLDNTGPDAENVRRLKRLAGERTV